MKIPLKLKIFAWYLRKGVILTKDNLVKRNWNGSTKCVFCTHDETIKHLFFQCKVARSIWSAIQIASNLYPPRSVANIFGNWLHGVDSKERTIIRVAALAVIWSLWLCRNDRFLMIKIHLSCRYFTDAQVCSVRGPHYNVWKIETFLWWRLHDCNSRRGIFLSDMGGLKIFV